MFQTVEMAPPDPILGLTDAFKADPNPHKINLSVGVYQDAAGKTPVLDSVKEAERRIIEAESTKSYKPIHGDPAYGKVVREMMFGADHEACTSGRAVTAHAPGGTGALRVVADYLRGNHPQVTVWISDPTWANHQGIFESAGLTTKTYAYFDKAANGLAFEAMIEAMKKIPAGDVVLLHGCCHNPTGVDPTPEQWKAIAGVMYDRGIVPLVDFAYQGFGRGLREDTEGLAAITRPGCEMFICSSYSKNFALYNERTGALTVLAKDADTAERVLSQIKTRIRTNYSNPPAHGGTIVTTILNDPDLRRQWEGEVARMRDRINGMRKLFVDTLDALGVKLSPAGNDFIVRQLGMFSFSGLNKQQVERLRSEHAIYIVGSGRINVAGMRETTMQRLCEAIRSVM